MYQNISIIGGCGRVGLPLGMALAESGFKVCLVDRDGNKISAINSGVMPFLEDPEAPSVLKKVIGTGHLKASSDKSCIRDSQAVIFVTGTPVDEHLNPRISDLTRVFLEYLPFIAEDTLIILRSTVYPGVADVMEHMLSENLGKFKLAFCPERIAQGKALKELRELPQIISGKSPDAIEGADYIFSRIAKKTIILSTMEAEFAKLMTNAWRYVEFAISNQFYMMAEEHGLDFFRIYDAIRTDYPRASGFSSPGLAAGPCLFKDTMQLSSFNNGNFFIGHSAMLINEGLPRFLVSQLEEKMGSLKRKKIAILGMTFKADCDDTRDSLSFKLKKELELKLASTIITDVYMPETETLEKAISESDGIILGTPHKEYRNLRIKKPFVDCWGIWRERSENKK